MRKTNPDNVNHKNEKQYTENKKERSEKSFDDIPIEDFHTGKNTENVPNDQTDFFGEKEIIIPEIFELIFKTT